MHRSSCERVCFSHSGAHRKCAHLALTCLCCNWETWRKGHPWDDAPRPGAPVPWTWLSEMPRKKADSFWADARRTGPTATHQDRKSVFAKMHQELQKCLKSWAPQTTMMLCLCPFAFEGCFFTPGMECCVTGVGTQTVNNSATNGF